MKRILLIILSALILCACGNTVSYSNDNLILPLFSTNSKNENKVWIGTFQLVFNDIKNNIIKKDIVFEGEEPSEELKGLNSEEFNSSMLNQSSYYTSWGKTSFEARDKIKKGIKEKFNETSDIIDNLDWRPEIGKYYAYAMLKKQFEFLNEFDKLEALPFNNSDKKYEYFGIKSSSDSSLAENADILFYNNENDYAVKLNTKNGDAIYLYRTDDNKSLKDLYNKMLNKKDEFYKYPGKYTSERYFQDNDTLKIPNMKFNKIREYDELCNKLIKGTNIYFSKAIETLQFELDNKGGKVKSEAIAITYATDVESPPVHIARHFNFDKTFAMFLVDVNKETPYMALRIYDLKDFSE